MPNAEMTYTEMENMVEVSIKNNDCHRLLYWMALLGKQDGEDVYVNLEDGILTVGCAETLVVIKTVDGHSRLEYA